jgi:hypothetical protein
MRELYRLFLGSNTNNNTPEFPEVTMKETPPIPIST